VNPTGSPTFKALATKTGTEGRSAKEEQQEAGGMKSVPDVDLHIVFVAKVRMRLKSL
jgi:hypothetical protein